MRRRHSIVSSLLVATLLVNAPLPACSQCASCGQVYYNQQFAVQQQQQPTRPGQITPSAPTAVRNQQVLVWYNNGQQQQSQPIASIQAGSSQYTNEPAYLPAGTQQQIPFNSANRDATYTGQVIPASQQVPPGQTARPTVGLFPGVYPSVTPTPFPYSTTPPTYSTDQQYLGGAQQQGALLGQPQNYGQVNQTAVFPPILAPSQTSTPAPFIVSSSPTPLAPYPPRVVSGSSSSPSPSPSPYLAEGFSTTATPAYNDERNVSVYPVLVDAPQPAGGEVRTVVFSQTYNGPASQFVAQQQQSGGAIAGGVAGGVAGGLAATGLGAAAAWNAGQQQQQPGVVQQTAYGGGAAEQPLVSQGAPLYEQQPQQAGYSQQTVGGYAQPSGTFVPLYASTSYPNQNVMFASSTANPNFQAGSSVNPNANFQAGSTTINPNQNFQAGTSVNPNTGFQSGTTENPNQNFVAGSSVNPNANFQAGSTTVNPNQNFVAGSSVSPNFQSSTVNPNQNFVAGSSVSPNFQSGSTVYPDQGFQSTIAPQQQFDGSYQSTMSPSFESTTGYQSTTGRPIGAAVVGGVAAGAAAVGAGLGAGLAGVQSTTPFTYTTSFSQGAQQMSPQPDMGGVETGTADPRFQQNYDAAADRGAFVTGAPGVVSSSATPPTATLGSTTPFAYATTPGATAGTIEPVDVSGHFSGMQAAPGSTAGPSSSIFPSEPLYSETSTAGYYPTTTQQPIDASTQQYGSPYAQTGTPIAQGGMVVSSMQPNQAGSFQSTTPFATTTGAPLFDQTQQPQQQQQFTSTAFPSTTQTFPSSTVAPGVVGAGGQFQSSTTQGFQPTSTMSPTTTFVPSTTFMPTTTVTGFPSTTMQQQQQAGGVAYMSGGTQQTGAPTTFTSTTPYSTVGTGGTVVGGGATGTQFTTAPMAASQQDSRLQYDTGINTPYGLYTNDPQTTVAGAMRDVPQNSARGPLSLLSTALLLFIFRF